MSASGNFPLPYSSQLPSTSHHSSCLASQRDPQLFFFSPHIPSSWWVLAVFAPIWCPLHETVHVACHHCFTGLLFLIKVYSKWCDPEGQMFRSVERSREVARYLSTLTVLEPSGSREDWWWLSARLCVCLGFCRCCLNPQEDFCFNFKCAERFLFL